MEMENLKKLKEGQKIYVGDNGAGLSWGWLNAILDLN